VALPLPLQELEQLGDLEVVHPAVQSSAASSRACSLALATSWRSTARNQVDQLLAEQPRRVVSFSSASSAVSRRVGIGDRAVPAVGEPIGRGGGSVWLRRPSSPAAMAAAPTR